MYVEINRWRPLTSYSFCMNYQGCSHVLISLYRPRQAKTQLAFYVNLHRAVIGPSATLTGRWRPDIDLRRMLTGNVSSNMCKILLYILWCPIILLADTEISEQTARIHRLVRASDIRICPKTRFRMERPTYRFIYIKICQVFSEVNMNNKWNRHT